MLLGCRIATVTVLGGVIHLLLVGGGVGLGAHHLRRLVAHAVGGFDSLCGCRPLVLFLLILFLLRLFNLG